MKKFLQGIVTMNEPLWVVPRLPQQIQNGERRHIEFRKIISLQ